MRKSLRKSNVLKKEIIFIIIIRSDTVDVLNIDTLVWRPGIL